MKNLTVINVLALLLVACSGGSGLRKADLIDNKVRSDYEAWGSDYMISTQGASTTKAAKYAFDNGGNIYDAATAATFAISVERPHSTGLGGGGFLILNDGDTNKYEAYDFREMAPRMAHSKMFLDSKGQQIKEKSLTGPFAVGTPGLVAGILEVHKKHGSLPLAKVMEPAIKLAEKGFTIF